MLPFILVVTYFFRKCVRDANRRIRTAIARINAFLQEYISGMSVVQLFNREQKARAEFAAAIATTCWPGATPSSPSRSFIPPSKSSASSPSRSIFWSGGNRVLNGTLSLGVLIAFTSTPRASSGPFRTSAKNSTSCSPPWPPPSASSNSSTSPRPLASPPTPFASTLRAAKSNSATSGSATADKPEPADDDWVLRDVSFRVAPGQTIAIVGHTGAGKTTLISLLLRFYDIQRGQILLDGVDIRKINIQDLRRLFGIVLQDPFLFTGTIESNIRLGTPGIDREAVRARLRRVGLADFIRALPEGVDAAVNERGSTLSVGQRQLINFARALAHNPRFLILDEATSSVDTKTELLIREALDRLLSGRTALVIAHRLSTIQHADRILVFHKGRLREQGAHQELLAQRGIYYRLYQLQYKEQELHLPDASAASKRPRPSLAPRHRRPATELRQRAMPACL